MELLTVGLQSETCLALHRCDILLRSGHIHEEVDFAGSVDAFFRDRQNMLKHESPGAFTEILVLRPQQFPQGLNGPRFHQEAVELLLKDLF